MRTAVRWRRLVGRRTRRSTRVVLIYTGGVAVELPLERDPVRPTPAGVRR